MSETAFTPLAPLDPSTVNSRAYWDQRFREDWRARGGPSQSRFFATVLLNWLPPRVHAEIASARLTICDWGCAEGDGTALLAVSFPENNVTGIDLSQVGISNAAAKYPGIDFKVGDIDAVADGYDVIVTSNVLEHLDDPWRAAALLARAARRYLIILVPFLDTTQDPEHRYVFGPLDLCEHLDEEVYLAEARALDTRAMPLSNWAGQQLLAVYRRAGKDTASAAEIAAQQKLQLVVENAGGIVDSVWPAAWRSLSGGGLAETHLRLRQEHATLTRRATELAETLASSEAQLTEAAATRDEARAFAAAQAQRLRLLEEQEATFAQRNSVLSERIGELLRRNSALTDRIRELARQEANLEEQNATLARWSQEAQQHYADVAGMLAAMLASTSWRVTAPMRRAIRRLLSRGPELTLPVPGLPRLPAQLPIPGESPATAPVVASMTAPQQPVLYQPAVAARAAVVGMLVQDFAIGGLEQFVVNLSKGLDGRGLPVAILVTGERGRASMEAERAGIAVHRCGRDPEALLRVVQELGIRVVLAHHCFVGWERLAAAGVPIIEVLQNLYHWHREDDERRQLRRHVARFIAVSHEVRDYAIRFLGLQPGQMLTIPNGIDTLGFLRPRASVLLEQRRQPAFVFLHVGQTWPAKCHHSVLTAFAQLHADFPHVRLVFAGAVADEDVHGRLVQRIDAMALNGVVTLAGALDRRGLSQLYARANALLLPSLYEGFSLASLEGLYFGLPLILTDVGGAREIIENEDVGILIAPPLPPENLSPERAQTIGSMDDAGHVGELHAAMRRMVLQRDIWTMKGLDGMVKFPIFDIDAVTSSYEACLAPMLTAGSSANPRPGN